MTQTQAILELHLPPVLATIAHAYLYQSNYLMNSFEIAFFGHGELCLTLENWNWGLEGACMGGHLELAELMISRGANDWNSGLDGACYGRQLALIELMISRGATVCHWCEKPITEHPVT